MSPLNVAICTISYTLWVEWYYLKNNYLTLRSRSRSHEGQPLRYATHRLMVMHPHTKYNWPIWKDKKSYGLDKLRWEEAEEAEAEEKIRLKQYVSLRSKGRHNNTLCVCYNSNFNADIIGGVMVSMFASSVVDCGFKPCPCHTTDNKICISNFCSKHAALIRIMCPRGSACCLSELAL